MPDDVALLTERLGRPPEGDFEVVVRSADGAPVVIRNAPFLRDGTPMPTRYWLVDPAVRAAVSRLEAAGGVRAAEAAVDPDELAAAHAAYAAERDAAIDPEHRGPRPSGGVGGTRRGVKCLHAHLAWFLAGGNDPVGRWVEARLGEGAGGEPEGRAVKGSR
ncbi:MAG TPA: DUF501 domain-containing protein [Acidimicrobiia bacterium]|nr:DUF501 domain-containing protein [Acidimicrobiia bacterium]